MKRSFFLVLAGIALGTACTPEEQCLQIAFGSPSAAIGTSAGFGTFAPCYFATVDGSGEFGGCYVGDWAPEGFDAGPGGFFDAGPGAVCQDAIFETLAGSGESPGVECADGPADTNGDGCIVWEIGGKVVATEWADWY